MHALVLGIVHSGVVEVIKELLPFASRQDIKLVEFFVTVLNSIEEKIADMLMKSINFVFGKLFGQIVVMNAEDALIISIVNMYLQALALLAAVIPSGFNIFTRNRRILIADHHVVEFFGEVIFLTD